MVTLSDIQLAQQRLRGIAVRTPLIAYFSPANKSATNGPHAGGGQLFLKPESLQPIGSFKLRGAYNKIASLSDDERRRGVISYSSGNHAQGVAYAARALGVKAVIVMPRNAPKLKVDSTAALGAEIVTVGPASTERMQRAEELSRQHGYVIVPPYNDEQIIAGQGTVGLEILEDLPDVDLVLVPSGGGGLISGVSSAIKLSGSRAKVVGVEPELANDAQQSFRSGSIVELHRRARLLDASRRTAHAVHRAHQLRAHSPLRRQHHHRHRRRNPRGHADHGHQRAPRRRTQRRRDLCSLAFSLEGVAGVEEGSRRRHRRQC